LVEDTLRAKRYSQAIFEIARERNEFDKWRDDLQQMSLLAKYPDFESVMDSPKFNLNEKIERAGAKPRSDGFKPCLYTFRAK
jgi:F0F1-type ATP synthase delta subunit